MLDTTPGEEREHWFEAFPGNEPELKEFLSKGYQIGFIDLADTPYPETIGASRDIGSGLYRARLTEP